jgi:hypothetical protein
MKDPSEALWKLMNKLEVSRPVETKIGWELGEGIKIFGPDTKAKCPNCDSWIETNRIWLVDEADGILKGCWHRDGRKVEKIIHPHVPYSGKVCLGKSGGASNALFAGVDKGRHYHSTERWFNQLGHDCPDAIKANCIACLDEYYESELEDGKGCNKCYDSGLVKLCENCGHCDLAKNFTEDLCRNCEEEVYRCRHCGETEVEEDGWLCDSCICRYDDCDKEIEDNSRYCLSHQFQCSCDCGCETRLDEEDLLCEWCTDNCIQEEEEEEEEEEEIELHNCSCSCGCSNQVEIEGQKCGKCTDLDTIPIPFNEENV